MSDWINRIPFSKKGRRQISPFVGHELLYDYLSGVLDQERSEAVANHLKFSRDAQLDLQKIELGIQYSEKLSETIVSEEKIQGVLQDSKYFGALARRTQWHKWPEGLRLGLKVILVVGIVSAIIAFVPWGKLIPSIAKTGEEPIVVSEIIKDQTTAKTTDSKYIVSGSVTVEPGGFSDELPNTNPTPSVNVPDVKLESLPTSQVVPVTTATLQAVQPSPSATAMVKPTAQQPAIPTATSSAAPMTESQKKAVEQLGESGMVLYRGDLQIVNSDVSGKKITEQLIAMGARKAGSVDLGYQKSKSSSMYYHFTMPSSKYQAMNDFLNQYGQLKLNKEKHSRVMPDGISRFIIEINERKKDERKK